MKSALVFSSRSRLTSFALFAMIMLGACRTGGGKEKQEDASQTITDPGEAPPIERPENPSEQACATPFMSVDTSTCSAQTSQTYGLTMENPAEWGFGAGTRTLWFGRIMCQDGTMPDIMRAGNVGPAPNPSTSPTSETGLGEAHDILDKWLVMCPGNAQPISVYHNMYRCGSLCPPPSLRLMNGEAFRAYIESQRASDESQHDDAYALAVKAHELEPDLELTILWLGLLEQRKNNFERALELYDKASTLNPHVPFASIQKCDVLIQLGREDEALILLDEILADLPADAAGKPRVDCLRATALHPTKPKEALELAARACAAGEKMCC